MKAQRTYVKAQPTTPPTLDGHMLFKKALAIFVSLTLIVSLCPLPSYAETPSSAPREVQLLSLGSQDDATSDSSTSPNEEELASQNVEADAANADAYSSNVYTEETIDAAVANASGIIVLEGKLNLIQTGDYYPPEDDSDKSAQFGTSVSNATIQKLKNRLNTAFMNPSSSGTVIKVDVLDLQIPGTERSNLKSWVEDVINTNPDLFYMG